MGISRYLTGDEATAGTGANRLEVRGEATGGGGGGESTREGDESGRDKSTIIAIYLVYALGLSYH